MTRSAAPSAAAPTAIDASIRCSRRSCSSEDRLELGRIRRQPYVNVGAPPDQSTGGDEAAAAAVTAGSREHDHAAAAAERGVSPVCAVVDAGGELMFMWRPDGAQVASVGVATDKARTAAIYRRPSKDFEDQASGGRASALHLARAVPLQGGMPVFHAGEVTGAVGVSGASSADEDQELAVLGSQALLKAFVRP